MKTESQGHVPVLLNEVIEGLAIKADGVYVDCTYGRGGHSSMILQQLNNDGRLLAIDQDEEAIRHGQQRFADDDRIELQHSPYTQLENLLEERGLIGKVDGLLFDLGVSSPQLDDAERGFSFQKNGPLDMRMNQSSGITAEKWLNNASEREMADVIKHYGEERHARRIARAIVSARTQVELNSTGLLAAIIKKVVPGHDQEKHPATRTFQAIRIFINRELDQLKEALDQVVDALSPGGRLAMISFHSLEDRLVKRFIRNEVKGDPFPSELPIMEGQLQPRLKMIAKRILPTEEEIDRNPRARSAVLRIAEKLA